MHMKLYRYLIFVKQQVRSSLYLKIWLHPKFRLFQDIYRDEANISGNTIDATQQKAIERGGERNLLRFRIRIRIYGTTKTSNSYRYQRDHNKIAMVVILLSTGPHVTGNASKGPTSTGCPWKKVHSVLVCKGCSPPTPSLKKKLKWLSKSGPTKCQNQILIKHPKAPQTLLPYMRCPNNLPTTQTTRNV